MYRSERGISSFVLRHKDSVLTAKFILFISCFGAMSSPFDQKLYPFSLGDDLCSLTYQIEYSPSGISRQSRVGASFEVAMNGPKRVAEWFKVLPS